MSRETRNRVVLVGWDGATFSILDPLMDSVMPFFKEFAAGGVRGVLHSTPYPLTPQAWTSLMTGRSPGNHGVYDFVRVEEKMCGVHQYRHPKYELVKSDDVRSETIWSIASRHGRRVTVLNFPCMFPLPAIDGFVIPGYVPQAYLPRATHPKDLYTRLKAQPDFNARELATDWSVERMAVQGLPEEDYEPWVKYRTAKDHQWFNIVSFLMQEEPCDLTAIMFDGVDRVQHLCYHLLDPHLASQHTSTWARHIRSLCLDYFRQLDHFLERIVAMAGREAQVFIASDHGFTAATGPIFCANTWLEQHGYLKWARDAPVQMERLALDDFTEITELFDWSETTAYAVTSAGSAIYIRQAAAPGAPGVPPSEYPEFRQRLIRALLAITDPSTGEPVINRILTREEAFIGKHMRLAPDLTLFVRGSAPISVVPADAPLKQLPSPWGAHHPHGIFLGRGPGIQSGRAIQMLSIVDVAPTLLFGLGLPVPADMDGTPAFAAFEPEFLREERDLVDSLGVRQQHDNGKTEALGPDVEVEILSHLKALGYL